MKIKPKPLTRVEWLLEQRWAMEPDRNEVEVIEYQQHEPIE